MKRVNGLIIMVLCFIAMSLINGEFFAAEMPPLRVRGGTTVADYQMVSFPVKPYDDQDPLTNENILIDELGYYDPYQWRLFQWDSCFWNEEREEWEFVEQHVELNDREGTARWGAEQNIEPGRAYWIISRNTRDIHVEGDLPWDEYILLEPGWNQIGNIYYVQTEDGVEFEPFPISSLFLSLDVGPGEVIQLIDPGNPYTYITLQDYVNGSYVNRGAESNLEVGKGYWLNNIDAQQRRVRLWFRVAAPGSTSLEINKTREFLERIAEQEDPPSPPSGIENSSSISLSGGGGCFIATAAYIDYGHSNVHFLREFRDKYLLRNSVGRILVEIYYRYSPALARFVEKSKPIMALVRVCLTLVIGICVLVSKPMYGFLIAFGFPFLGVFLFKKGVWGKCKATFIRKSRVEKRKM